MRKTFTDYLEATRTDKIIDAGLKKEINKKLPIDSAYKEFLGMDKVKLEQQLNFYKKNKATLLRERGGIWTKELIDKKIKFLQNELKK